uniref:hypothetical protein n=1 Tax=Pseudoclavibacter sp. RFBI5 TaxID=2080578 RepID=UPI0015E47007|nr:hypothetical protein [Pseudoclavibacter sp. RFBI5]
MMVHVQPVGSAVAASEISASEIRASEIAEVAHPVIAPAQLVFGHLGIEIEPVAVCAMASTFRYVRPIADGRDEFGGLEAAFDLFEAAGFNCEQFRTADSAQFLEAARREHALTERRWRAAPMYAIHPETDPATGSRVLLPVALSEFDAASVRVTSIYADRSLSYRELSSASLTSWGYAAPVPSLRAIIAPSRFSFARRAARSLGLALQRMRVAEDGLSMLSDWLATRPSRGDVAAYRHRLRAVSCGDSTYGRARLVDALVAYGGANAHDATRLGFLRSAGLHRAFLDGDDTALTAIVAVERAALETVRVWRAAEPES